MANGRIFVVDTDILRSAGDVGEATARPVLCARFLEALIENQHGVAVTNTIFEEWNRHRSRFALRWLRVMFGKKRVRFVTAVSVDFERNLARVIKSKSKYEAVLKDRHLVETALAADGRIASLDERARVLFRACAAEPSFSALGDLLWVNPTIVGEESVVWLQRNAPNDGARRLRQ